MYWWHDLADPALDGEPAKDFENHVLGGCPAGELADEFDADQLSNVMSSVPKDARRVLIAADATPAVEALLERYFHKAHRLADDAERALGPPGAIPFLTASH